jgi:hypothetical protein
MLFTQQIILFKFDIVFHPIFFNNIDIFNLYIADIQIPLRFIVLKIYEKSLFW